MDWKGFLRRIFNRMPSEVDPTAVATAASLTRALQEARKVALRASFQTQLLRSGVLCVASYLPQAWKEGTRFKVAIALLDEAGCRAYQGQHKRVEETDWCLKAYLPTEGIDLRDPTNRYKTQQDLPEPIRKYITRLEFNRYLVDGEECAVFARVAPGDYRCYTNFAFKTRIENFQSMTSDKRANVKALVQMQPNKRPTEIAMEDFDISASQLKLALALRGHYYPVDLNVWDNLAANTHHSAKLNEKSSAWRKIVKAIALTIVQGNDISIVRAWKEATNKTPKVGQTKGLKAAVKAALWKVFPELERSISLPQSTPDGVPIHGRKSGRKKWVRGTIRSPSDQEQSIDTSYDIVLYSKEPDVLNVLGAHEAWLIRETIFGMPSGLPILPLHDQLYFHEGFRGNVTSKANDLLKRLANGEFKHPPQLGTPAPPL